EPVAFDPRACADRPIRARTKVTVHVLKRCPSLAILNVSNGCSMNVPPQAVRVHPTTRAVRWRTREASAAGHASPPHVWCTPPSERAERCQTLPAGFGATQPRRHGTPGVAGPV